MTVQDYLLKFRKISSLESLEKLYDHLNYTLTDDQELINMYRAADHRRAELVSGGRLFDLGRTEVRLALCPIKKVAIGYKKPYNNAPKIRFACLRRYSGEPMTTTTPQRIGGWLLGPLAPAFSRSVKYDAGVVAVYRCVIFSANISNARRTSTDDTNLMGRFFLLPLSPCGITHCG